MAGARCIAPRPQIDAPGNSGGVLNGAGWPHTGSSARRRDKARRGSGRLSRSRAGFETHFRAILRCRCRPRRFIEACSSRVAVCSSAPCSDSSAASATFGTHVAALASAHAKGRSWTPSRLPVPGRRCGPRTSRSLGGRSARRRAGTYIATLVERQSRYVMLVRLPNKERQTVIRALARRIRRLPHGLMKSLTWDRGSELTAHRAFTIATNIQVYFCNPQSPWQRGSNENTNGLLRQYLPHAVDLSSYSQTRLDAIAMRLNTRPRMTLAFHTPATKLAEIVASMG